MTFKDLNLSDTILSAIEKAGYTEATPIQAGAIPPGIEGKDILGIAQTGTGKTASFVIPMLSRLEKGRARARMPRSLILAPTRELAAQVAASFEELGTNHKYTLALLIGGVSFAEQSKKLDRGVDILIATPGRLLDHFGRGKILLTGVEILVIDEADRMLDMGFIDDIKKICGLLPPRIQTMFFSATMPPEIQKFTKSFLKDPVKIEVARQSTIASTITQRFQSCSKDHKDKRAKFREILKNYTIENAIVFCNRKRDVTILLKSMEKHGFNVKALHGDLDQRERMDTLERFRNNEITFLVASDVAARGLDIPNVGHVFNYDIPTHPEDYVHRIGRTGRAGREGHAVTFVGPGEQKYLDAILSLCKMTANWLGAPASQEPIAKGRAAATKPKTRQSERKKTNDRSNKTKNADEPKIDHSKDSFDQKRHNSSRKAKNNDKEPVRKARSQGDNQQNNAVVGMGNHTPAFLKRAVPRPKKQSTT